MIKTEQVEASYYNNEGGFGVFDEFDIKNISMQSSDENGSGESVGMVLEKKRSQRMRFISLTDLPSRLSVIPAAASNDDLPSSLGSTPRMGRPPGTGWKQQLALFGDWMTNSAGRAVKPLAIHVDKEEDVSTKILSFVKKRRALCIISGCGSVYEVTLRQSVSSKRLITYEGRFDIVCLSGSYLPEKSGGRYHHTGGVSISLSDPVGQVVGGAIGGKLIAATSVQVVAFSFKYDRKAKKNKRKNKREAHTKSEISYDVKSSVQVMASPCQLRYDVKPSMQAMGAPCQLTYDEKPSLQAMAPPCERPTNSSNIIRLRFSAHR